MRSYKESDINIGDILLVNDEPSYKVIRWPINAMLLNIKNQRIRDIGADDFLYLLNRHDFTQFSLLKAKSNNFNSLYDKLNGH